MTTPFNTDYLSAFFTNLTIKRKVFVSYHHDEDQTYYDAFAKMFCEAYDCVTDNSLERAFDSDDCDYVMRRIRENHISGSSATIVLLGAQTPWRKYIDWEIKATLDKMHGLLGVVLPTCQNDYLGRQIVPDRFHDNFQSGYALWTRWDQLNVATLKALVQSAIDRPYWNIRNDRAIRSRNG